MDGWLPIIVMILLGVAFAGAGVAASQFLGPRNPTPEKLAPYECGVPLLSETRERFSVRFYLVAIMFILFDIETVFLIPWAVLYKKLGVAGLAEVGIFFAVLGFGLAYLWKRGGLEWD